MEPTPTTARLGGVIEFNRGLLTRARELNRRAGEAVFLVMDRAGLATWLANRLQGARRGSEVTDPDSLKLPELDSAEVTRVLAECPDTLVVLGVELPVEYRDGAAPLVRLTDEMVNANQWNDLSDEGIMTPGGRPVEIAVKISYWNSVNETDVARLKARMRDHRNESTWNNWDRPELAMPDMNDVGETIPEIREAVYGRCVVTGVDLMAYGVVCYNSRRYHSNDPYFKGEWLRDRAEAEQKRAEAVVKLEEIRKKIRERAQVEAAEADAEAAKGELQALKSHEDWWDLEDELRRAVEERTGWYSSFPSDLEGCLAWTVDTRALKAQVEATLATVAERKAQAKEAEAKLAGTLPEGLVEAFGGETSRAASFWAKARGLDRAALDNHIIYNCGRARVRAHLEEVSGDADFFCGADPNQVVSFIGRLMDGEFAELEPASEPQAEPHPEVKVGGLNLGSLAGAWGAKVRR